MEGLDDEHRKPDDSGRPGPDGRADKPGRNGDEPSDPGDFGGLGDLSELGGSGQLGDLSDLGDLGDVGAFDDLDLGDFESLRRLGDLEYLDDIDELDDFDDDHFVRPPHIDDRLWRHPSEVAAQAAITPGETLAAAQGRAIRPGLGSLPPQLRRRGVALAAMVIIVGASAVAIGAFTARTAETAPIAIETLPNLEPVLTGDTIREPQAEPISVPATPEPTPRSAAEAALASRVHHDVADSLPRVEAATRHGMREGSGAFVTTSGHIVTSAGLVDGADYILVWTDDGARLHGEVLAVDPFSDVAVLTVGDRVTKPARLDDEAAPATGHQVLAIDHDGRTMTVGEVTSYTSAQAGDDFGDEAARIMVDMIDPAAVPGSAIVDDQGNIIAVVNYDIEPSRQATPAGVVQRVAAELIALGETSHPWLGIAAEPSFDGTVVQVTEVVKGSPAQRAGLRVGDIIDSVESDHISTSTPLWTLLQARRPGDSITLAVTRNGNRRLVTATLEARPG